jgi:hypothetical protein
MRIDELTIEVRDPDLKRVGQVPDYNLPGAEFILRFNNVGSWSLRMPFGDPLVDFLRTPGYGIVVTGPNGQVIFSGPTLAAKLEQTPEDPKGIWVIEGADDTLVLTERLAYPDPAIGDVGAQTSSHDRRTGDAETVMKGYVNVNAGPGAVVSRRVAGLTVATNQNRGPVVTNAARFTELQTLLFGIAESAALGYDVKQVNDDLVFDVFEPVDRSAFVRLDVENDLLRSSEFGYVAPEVTRVIVAGQGEAIDRLFIERSNTDSTDAETAWNRRIEQFRDARQSVEVSELEQAGDEVLADTGKTVVSVAVTPSDDVQMLYGVDWNLGDIVSVTAGEVETTATVTEVGLSIEPDGVRIGATLGTPTPFDFETRLVQRVAQQEDRVSALERNENFGACGQVTVTTNQTVTITTAGQYVSTGIDGVFDTAVAQGFVKGTADTFGVKNNTDVTRLMRVYASADCRGGNNQVHGAKLAKNGTPIDASECRAFTGSGPNDFAKLITSLVIKMQPGDEVSLFLTNFTSTDNLTVGRARLIATAV